MDEARADLYRQVAERDGERCAWCSKSPEDAKAENPEGLVLDHRTPKSAGGRLTFANAQLLCVRCNSSKGTGPDDNKTVAFASSVWQHGFTIVPNAVLLDRSLSAHARILYSVLTHYARQTEECWPGQERLAEDLRLSEPTLRKALKELVDRELVERRRRGRGMTNIYLIHPPKAKGGDLPEAPRTQGGSVQERKSADALERKQLSGKEQQEGSIKKKKEEDEQVVFDHWLTLCGDNGFNLRSKELTPSRRRLIASGLKEATVEECCAALTGMFLSDWYMQRSYYELSYCFGWSPQNKKSLRERLDSFISDAERHGKDVRRVTSDQEGTLRRAKDAVRSMYAYPGNGTAQERGQAAVDWLKQHGIEVVAPSSPDDLPTFREQR